MKVVMPQVDRQRDLQKGKSYISERLFRTLQARFPEAEHFKDLLTVLTRKEIQIRYKNNWLGYLWSLINPLAYAATYFFVFKIVMKTSEPHYALLLIVGLFPWQWVSNSLGSAPNVFIGNASLIKKVQFPVHTLVGANVFNDGVHFALSLPVIAIFLILDHFSITPAWTIGVPTLFLLQVLLVYGICLAVASLNVFFRDLERLVVLIMAFAFFLTPIAYSESSVPHGYHFILFVNPVAPLILAWRHLLMGGRLDWSNICLSGIWAILCVLAGSLLYTSLSRRFSEVI